MSDITVFIAKGSPSEVNSFVNNYLNSNKTVIKKNKKRKKSSSPRVLNCWQVVKTRSTSTLNFQQSKVLDKFLKRQKTFTFHSAAAYLKDVLPNNTPSNVALANYLISKNYNRKVFMNDFNRKTTFWSKL